MSLHCRGITERTPRSQAPSSSAPPSYLHLQRVNRENVRGQAWLSRLERGEGGVLRRVRFGFAAPHFRCSAGDPLVGVQHTPVNVDAENSWLRRKKQRAVGKLCASCGAIETHDWCHTRAAAGKLRLLRAPRRRAERSGPAHRGGQAASHRQT